MPWLEDEIVRLGGKRIAAHKRSAIAPRENRFRFDNGLYLTINVSHEALVAFDFTVMGNADASVAMPALDQETKFEGKIRGYDKRLLAQSRKQLGTLPSEILKGLAQASETLLNPSWWLWLYECVQPRLLQDGFPAWKVTSAYLGGPSVHLVRSPDYTDFAGRILGQVDNMRRLLQAAREAAPARKVEPG